jgi:hypothetical protein
VTLGVVWPTVTRALCFPLRAALYLRAKDCAPADFRKKTRLALAGLSAAILSLATAKFRKTL